MRSLCVVAVCATSVAAAADLNADGCDDDWAAATRACVHPDAQVAPGATLGARATIGPGVVVPADAVVRGRATIAGRSSGTGLQPIGSGATVGRRSTVGSDASIGAGTSLAADVAIGAGFESGTGASVGYGSTLGSRVALSDGSTVGNLVSFGDRVDVGPMTSVGRGTQVASGSAELGGTSIWGDVGAQVTIGGDSTIAGTARVRHGATVGENVEIQSGAVLGRSATLHDGSTLSVGAVARSGSIVPAGAVVPSGWIVPASATFHGTGGVEDCATGGDEDGDALANCDDPQCESAPVCNSIHNAETTLALPGGVPLVVRGVGAGTFEMGCKVGRDNVEGADCVGSNAYWDGEDVHLVTLTHELWCGRTEVTQQQFRTLTAGNYNPSQHDGSPLPDSGPTAPVDNVSWNDAAWWTNQLNAHLGLPSCYSCTGSTTFATQPTCSVLGDPYSCGGYRLPTEAEWEFVARGGASQPYSGSSTAGPVAWYQSNIQTKPVATKAPNAWGFYDMSGNAFEWTNDRATEAVYPAAAVSDPTGPGSGVRRVLRGGNFANDARIVRVAYRHEFVPTHRTFDFGFRTCRSVPPL